MRDAGRADARAYRCTTGGWVGRGHEWVGAVVHVEHGGLAAFHEHVFAGIQSGIELVLGVHDHRLEAVAVGQEVFDDGLRVNRLAVVHFDQHLVFDIQRGFDLLTQDGFVEDVLHANSHARDLVGISWADTAAGGANRALAQETFLHAV